MTGREPLIALADVVAEIRAAQAPDGLRVKIAAIDGPGGAGKTSLAKHLAAGLDGAPILHTDDFASRDNPVDWWPELIEHALEPLAGGRLARFTPTDWDGQGKDVVTIEPTEVVLLEGVSASRKEFRPYLAYAIWVDAPVELRLERGIARDGPDSRALWEKWLEEEDRFFSREKLREGADVILPGDRDLWR